jgi:O-antigen ligase
MKEIIKNIYSYVGNKFYFKLLYLFVSLTFVTILKDVPGISLLTKVAQVWGIILILFMIIEDYKRRKIYKFDIPLALFMITTLILNIFVYRNIENIKYWMVNLILFLTIFTVDVFRSKKALIKEMNIITYFYVIFMFIASSISLLMKLFFIKIEISGVTFALDGVNGGIFENKNALSIAAALAIVMCIYLNYITRVHRVKLFLLANIILQAIIMMIGSHGRSALLVVVAVLYIFIFVYNKSKYIRVILLLLPILACGVFFQLDKNHIRDFTSGRSSLWTSASIVIENHPLTGVGSSNFVEAVTKARETDDLPGLTVGGVHNIYVQMATINGVISLILFLAFLMTILAFIIEHLDKLQRKEKLVMTTLTSLIVGIIAVNLFESNLVYLISFISMIFWIYLGYLISILDNKNIK